MTEKEFEEMNLRARSSTDYKLDKSKPILLMLDGRSFSKFTKQFEEPFDNDFVNMMNDTAKYLCANIQNAVYAFVQSDEISIYLKPCEELTEPWFGGRLNKICSVAAGMASSFFTTRYIAYKMEKNWSDSDGIFDSDMLSYISSIQLPTFDCKAWNVSTYNEVIDWFVYRQKDCIRNSKQQFAQTYAPHKELLNKTADMQITYVKETTCESIDWNQIEDGLKYGRLIYKQTNELVNPTTGEHYFRNSWENKPAQEGTNGIQYLI